MQNSEPSPPTRPPVPKVVIYCDESCHDLNGHHAWMSIGGLRLPRERKRELTQAFRQLCERRNLRGEVKWTKTSISRLDDYKALVDFFFDEGDLRFRAIVVEQAKVQMMKFHEMDRELAFYKFYYEMLEKWLEERAEYLILLDYKQNSGADRYSVLRSCLERHLQGTSQITDLTVIDSWESPLAQLCDLLTGALAAAYNGPKPDSPKEALAQHIANRAGFPTLQTSTGPTARKFNIFKIDLERTHG